MKKYIKFFIFLFTFVFVIGGLSSCDSLMKDPNTGTTEPGNTNKPTETPDQKEAIYKLAVESGYTGTYEEWLESIKGDYIELSVTSTHIVWKYANESIWRNLIELSKLSGLQGAAGSNGADGKDGVDGKTPEFRVNAGYLEWKYTTDTEWIKLYEINTEVSKPEEENNPTNGLTPYIGENGNWWIGNEDTKIQAEGKDGKTPEFRVNDGYMEWKYSDESTWKQLYKITSGSGSTDTDWITVTLVTDYEFGDNDQIIPIESSEIVMPVGAIAEPDVTKEGYKLIGWYYYDEYEEEYLEWKFKYYYSSADITLYAVWEELYTVTFVSDNGDEIHSLEVAYGDSVKFPEIELAEGYTVSYYYNGIKLNDNFKFYYQNDMVIDVVVFKAGYESDDNNYTYNMYVNLIPYNWNELTYQDANDEDLIEYISGEFFTFDYKYDENGEIVPGGFEVEYAAASKLEDVTSLYAGKYAVPADATNAYAYKITLRDDLKWDDGTAITALDFVYTMQQLLDPKFQNYRADSFFNSAIVIHNAKNYLYQGNSGWVTARDFHDTWESAKTDTELLFTLNVGSVMGDWIAMNYGSYLATNTPAWVISALGANATEEEILLLEGKTWAEISENAALYDTWTNVLAFWKTVPDEELDFFAKEYTKPEVKWEEVGIFVGDNEYEIVLILDNTLTLLDENGELTYNAVYNFGCLPLVKKDLYESCKQEPVTEGGLWTSNYNSSVETSASWGPYKLTYYQVDKQYILERNEYWYGWNMEEYNGQYMTDKIVCDQVEDWNTAWLLFQQGELDLVSIDPSVADIYKHSEQAVFTPDDYVGSLQLQSNYNALKARESYGYNKTLLAQTDFRKALSLAINRADYNNICTTASKPGFGIFNSMHYYDVENGGVYRNEDVAKQVLCDVYGVDISKYESLDAAYNSITGYDVAQARDLVNKAVDAAIAAGDYNGRDIVKLTFGANLPTDTIIRSYEFIEKAWTEMVVGTKLEGKLELEIVYKDAAWATDFRAGGYEVCMGGWSGAAWDPGYFLLAYLSPDYMYSTAWDTYSVTMEFDIDPNKEGLEVYSLMDWYNILNGAHEDYNWAAGLVEDKIRLNLIAALEKEILSVYYTVPLQNYYSATLISYKWEYASRDYNTFMGYGGIRYMTYNYTDEEWDKFRADNNYQIDYTK